MKKSLHEIVRRTCGRGTNNGNDTLIAGTGGGTMAGGAGSDTYVFNQNSGNVSIWDTPKSFSDVISFGTGISADSVSLSLYGDELIIDYGTQKNRITFQDVAFYGSAKGQVIGQFLFADGTQGAYSFDAQGDVIWNVYDVKYCKYEAENDAAGRIAA